MAANAAFSALAANEAKEKGAGVAGSAGFGAAGFGAAAGSGFLMGVEPGSGDSSFALVNASKNSAQIAGVLNLTASCSGFGSPSE